ncbi:MAG: glycoside hydrolase family 2 protein [Armatimonadota bacterium]|nr:glycoside hydrolase family 2 protein [bacterium]
MSVIQLDGAWELRQVGSDEFIKAQVPGCVHLDLMRAHKIEDPFNGDNELKVSWVHETDWEYSRSFQADAELLAEDCVYLECDGLDTIACITLNGEVLAETANMYVQHRFDVKEKLHEGENHISIRFSSPVNYVKPMLKKDPLLSPGESIPGASYTRKSPSQWGWDWGPRIPTSGIWKSIRLAGYSVARIDDVRIRQKHRKSGQVTLDVEITIERFRKTSCSVGIKITHPNGTVEEATVKPTGSRAKWTVIVEKPQLWWPNGYGDQPLYALDVSLTCDDKHLNVFTRRIGLHTVALEQKKDKHGRGFVFSINGVKIFAKGADWIPLDQFPTRTTVDHYRHLVQSAARAHMNMLRVWGGGFYEDEIFYDLCDEYGILVWQDFMFACAFYPADPAYLDNVRQEAEYNIKRLRNRACIALWCGNNEMEWLGSGEWDSKRNALRKEQYRKIFYDLLPSMVSQLDPENTYWPSSPCSVKPFEDPNGQESGDGHYWDVWHGRLPFTAYRQQFHRFMSEFGFQSLPAIETCKAFADSDDLNIFSHVMECHQKNKAGNGLILHYLSQNFRLPKNFEMMCYVSQLLQAEAMRYGIEHWRRNRPRCMGTLYWQFNDCWPTSSWSSIDYYGRWKALHYFAKRFYAPVMLSVCEEGTSAELHVTNDLTKPVKVEIRWFLEKLDGMVLRKSKIKTRIDGEQSKCLAALDFSEELAGDAIREVVLVHELLVNGKSMSLGITPFAPSKHLELHPAKITVRPVVENDRINLEVSSDKAVRFVCLTVPKKDVVFSDNYFDIPAGRTVTVQVDSDIDPASLSKIKAYSLRDSY